MTAFWTDIYQQHFQRCFNKPFDIQIYHDPNGASLKLATYDWAMQGYRIYASMGLADRLADEEDDEDDADFGEAILYADVPDREAPRLFINALFFILRQGIPLDSRFALGFGAAGDDFQQRYQKSAFYFARARGPDEQFDKVRRGEAFGRVYQAYFLTPEEDEYLEQNGPDAFEEKFFAAEDVLSVRRSSCV